MKKSVLYVAAALVMTISLSLPNLASAHCQVPCGIYDDYARVIAMLEDATTIRKSVKLMVELNNKTDVQSKQQFVRWVNNKELHAQKIISSIADYFLTQRVKAKQKDYVERLKAHHAIIVNAMKAKQSSDMKAVEQLEQSIKVLVKYYPEHKHD